MRRSRLIAIVPLVLLVTARDVSAQQALEAPSSPVSSVSSAPATQALESLNAALTAQSVHDRIRQLQEDRQLDDATRARAIDYYRKALDELQAAEQWAARASAYEKAVRDVPALLQAARDELKRIPTATPVPADVADWTMARLQQELVAAEAQLTRTRQRLAELDKEPKRRSDRRIQLRQRREEIDKELGMPVAPQGPPVVAEAARVYEQARTLAREGERAAALQELASYDASVELLSVQRDLAAQQVSRDEKLVRFWQDAITSRRQADAARLAREGEEARRRAQADGEPVARDIAALAEKVTRLARKRDEILQKEKEVSQELEARRALLNHITRNAEEVRAKVEASGMTRAMGMMLRTERMNLPRVRDLRRRVRQLQEIIADLEVEQIDLRRQRDSLPDIRPLIEAEVSKIDPAWIERRQDIREQLTSLDEKQREGFQSLLADYGDYARRLIELEEVTESLIARTEAYQRYIEERFLWLRSDEELTPRGVLDAWQDYRRTFCESQWSEVLNALSSDARANPATVSFLALVVLLAIGGRGRLRDHLEKAGDRARQKLNTSFAPTGLAVLYTVLLSISWPLLFWLLSWRLATSTSASDLAKAVAFALGRVAVLFLIYGSIREVLRPKGLAEAHLGWSPSVLRMVRMHLLWLMVVSLVLVFVGVLVERFHAGTDWKQSASRPSYLAAMAAMAAFVAVILRPSKGVFAERIARNRGGRLDRYRMVWYLGLIAIPVVMGVLTIVGYYYTALQLMSRIHRTAWLVLIMLVFRGLILRWLFLSHRKLAIARARKRLAEKQAELARGTAGAVDEPAAPPEEPEPDIAALSGQARQLLNAAMLLIFALGMWYIWVDILPALSFFRRIPLYPSATVTLADAALAIATLIMTVIAARNVAAFLEITILPRMPIMAGERYAIITVSRYAITALGIVMAFGFVGIGWSSVQWLVAAMTVGLGFGLQEIFANFVSGLILLFERPIRVGDTVTVGETSGTISRIHIRATTVTTWDRKELIIPNKEFVTGQVVNWTLSDSVLRIVIPVGVAYGSDTSRVEAIMRRVAEENPLVLRDPAPQIFFVGFGASSLDFEMRVFLAGVDKLSLARHELLNALEREFRKAGIEIAFPQQDIHIRSVGDVFRVVHRAEGSREGPAG